MDPKTIVIALGTNLASYHADVKKLEEMYHVVEKSESAGHIGYVVLSKK